MPSFESLRGTVAQLYNEPDARVDLVATGLRKARVDKVIGDTNVERLSALSTVSGVLEEGGRLCPSLAEKVEEAKPYLAKASEKEG